VARTGWTTAGITPPLPPSDDPVGIVGYGRIGREVAARVRALGFPVHAWDPYVAEFPADVQRHQDLAELAAAVNHLSLHVPATDVSRGIVGADTLRALGSNGHLVNTARGALVDEAELLAALDSGELGFASLDVLGSEPPVGTAARLASHERVLVTPHIAYLSTDSLPRLRQRAAEILRDLLTGVN
jgi:phosphoglycerate dehydrogenase-like enzyme